MGFACLHVFRGGTGLGGGRELGYPALAISPGGPDFFAWAGGEEIAAGRRGGVLWLGAEETGVCLLGFFGAVLCSATGDLARRSPFSPGPAGRLGGPCPSRVAGAARGGGTERLACDSTRRRGARARGRGARRADTAELVGDWDVAVHGGHVGQVRRGHGSRSFAGRRRRPARTWTGPAKSGLVTAAAMSWCRDRGP